jgi:hypothetical protein
MCEQKRDVYTALLFALGQLAVWRQRPRIIITALVPV